MVKNLFSVVTLFSLLCFSACDKVNYTINSENGVKTSDIIWFKSVSADTILADSSSTLNITVGLNKLADTAYSVVKFTTDKGFFDNEQKSFNAKVNAEKEVTVNLTSAIEVGPVNIRAEIIEIAIDTVVCFIKSLPDYIQLTPSFINSSDYKASVTIELYKSKGRVGKDIYVFITYQALDSPGSNIDIPDFVVISDKKASFQINNPLQLPGKYNIICKTIGANSDSVATSSIVNFQ
jgi:hypothetical protein